jgi:hypothetical protein
MAPVFLASPHAISAAVWRNFQPSSSKSAVAFGSGLFRAVRTVTIERALTTLPRLAPSQRSASAAAWTPSIHFFLLGLAEFFMPSFLERLSREINRILESSVNARLDTSSGKSVVKVSSGGTCWPRSPARPRHWRRHAASLRRGSGGCRWVTFGREWKLASLVSAYSCSPAARRTRRSSRSRSAAVPLLPTS